MNNQNLMIEKETKKFGSKSKIKSSHLNILQ